LPIPQLPITKIPHVAGEGQQQQTGRLQRTSTERGKRQETITPNAELADCKE